MPAQLTIVGLGPGDASLLTIEARDLIAGAPEVWLRTSRHPTVAALPAGPRYPSFDEVYERAASFEDVYREIAERVIALARRPEGVVYAVPGHPLFGEETTRLLRERADAERLPVRIVAGVSFLDVVAERVGVDPVDGGLLLLDALALDGRRRLLVPQRPTIIAQVHDARVASRVKLALLEAYPPEHPVRIVKAGAADDGDPVCETTVERLDRDGRFDHLASLYVHPLAMTEDFRTFEGLRTIVAQLRNPEGGCPWDLQQTHESLKRFLLEEAYEALDALDEPGTPRLAEELGDLLMQIVLHAQLAEDAGDFVVEDVIASIAAKLVRRHPHVFGDVRVEGPQDVLRNWETLKTEERGDAPLLDAVPRAMPALAQAQSVQSRAAKAGLASDELARDVQHVERVLRTEGAEPREDAVGALLFDVVAFARAHDIDAEEALRLAVRRFRERVGAEERKGRAAP